MKFLFIIIVFLLLACSESPVTPDVATCDSFVSSSSSASWSGDVVFHSERPYPNPDSGWTYRVFKSVNPGVFSGSLSWMNSGRNVLFFMAVTRDGPSPWEMALERDSMSISFQIRDGQIPKYVAFIGNTSSRSYSWAHVHLWWSCGEELNW